MADQIPDQIPSMAALEPKSKVQDYNYPPKPLAKLDADIRVTYTGVCATDHHMIDNDWGFSRYPLVPGHEVVGRVIGIGPDVKGLEVGDIVGLGALAQACGECEYCIEGIDNLCLKRKFTYFENTIDETGEHVHHGGFSAYLRTDSRYLFKIPEGYEEKYVGPLMCGGLTVAAPLYEFAGQSWDLKGKRVGIVGIGGLGHMAIQFAEKMGAETYAVSRGTSKRKFCKALGVSGFIDSSSSADMSAIAGKLHYLLFCVSGGSIDINHYVGLMRPYGVLHFVGVPDKVENFNLMPLIFSRLTLSSSPIGASNQMRAMLEFAAKNDIKPIIEEFTHTTANEALQKVRDGSIRFRAVLKNDLI
ncbi:MAG: NAD(P)-dependent alcohol dehydrogenase [Burkholderiales bacterium]|nr:NAD(P)-dependent alcohol dehydrogenase [Nitrosomonas sp.]MCP5273965.1 NAD(P)-dependent alcohol dehydrogenase [Burkholderiales bacterium]